MSSLLLILMLATAVMAQAPITFQYFYDDLGQLIKVVDSTGIVIEYVYDAVGNILEIKRSTITGLAIFNFTPQQGPIGAKVTIQGQGFSATPSENTVQFNGVPATVTTATPVSLMTTVPLGATTGPIAVTVARQTVTSDRNFTVLQVPVITSVNPTTAFAGFFVPSFLITGVNLTDSTFSFLLASTPPAIIVNTASFDPAGTSTALSLVISGSASDPFVVVATNAAGSSDPSPSPANTLTIVGGGAADSDSDGFTDEEEFIHGTDPLNPDTDGDGFSDSHEVGVGANPLDKTSVPNILPPGEAVGLTFSILNTVNPAQDSDSDGFTDLYELAMGSDPRDPTSVPSVLPPPSEAVGLTFSILNTSNPGQAHPDHRSGGNRF